MITYQYILKKKDQDFHKNKRGTIVTPIIFLPKGETPS